MNGDLSWSLVRASRLRPDAAGIVDGSTFIKLRDPHRHDCEIQAPRLIWRIPTINLVCNNEQPLLAVLEQERTYEVLRRS
jgi:hypothetical protein